MKKTLIIGLVGLSAMALTACGPDDNTTSESPKSNSPKSSVSITANHRKNSADKLKLGMTKTQVKKLLGKPNSDAGNVWLYDEGNVVFDSSTNKVASGTLGTLVSQYSASRSESKASESTTSANAATTSTEDLATQKSFAQSFGRKTTDYLAKMSMVYKTIQLDANTIGYLWDSGHGMMIRLDTSNRMTNVYLYNENAPYGKGTLLFTGRTLYQDAKTYTFYQQ